MRAPQRILQVTVLGIGARIVHGVGWANCTTE